MEGPVGEKRMVSVSAGRREGEKEKGRVLFFGGWGGGTARAKTKVKLRHWPSCTGKERERGVC